MDIGVKVGWSGRTVNDAGALSTGALLLWTHWHTAQALFENVARNNAYIRAAHWLVGVVPLSL